MNSILRSVDTVKELNETNFVPVEDYGIEGDFVESQAFGYLAIRSFLNLPISFPSTTRCKNPVNGGVMVKNF